jgi:hypothetical protein
MSAQNPILHYTVLTYLMSWSILFVLHLLNVNLDSASAFYAISLGYMSAPAIVALLLGKLVYKMSFADYGLQLQPISFRWIRNVAFFFLAWVVLFFALYYVLGNVIGLPFWGKLNFSDEYFSQTYSAYLQKQGVSQEQAKLVVSYGPFFTLSVGIISSILLGYFFSLPFYLGQELAWRGFLHKHTQEMGFWKSNFAIGLIWGGWLIPLVLMGRSFFSYTWQAVPITLIYYLVFSYLLSFIRIKSKSILGSAALQGMIAGFSQFIALCIENGNELVKNIEGVHSALVLALLMGLILKLYPDFIVNYADNQTPAEPELPNGSSSDF